MANAGSRSPGGAVDSVNGQTGTVTLDTDDVSEGSTNLYHTSERVDDRVANLLVAGANITLTYDDSSNTLTVASTASGGGLDLVSYSQYGGF